MSVILQFGIGIFMLAVTVAINAYAIVKSGLVMEKKIDLIVGGSVRTHIIVITAVTLWLSLAMLCAMMLWALILSGLGLFASLYDSLYFSMISFTTLGFGDVLLPGDWGLLAGFIAIDGFILFGLNTATLFEVLRYLRSPKDS